MFMSKLKKKYRLLFVVLSPLYINFFFFTPFFHYHPSDGNSFQPENVDIHSHISEHSDGYHEHDFGQHLDDCQNHEGMHKLNTYKFISLIKSTYINQIHDLFIRKFNPPKSSQSEFRIINTFEFPDKEYWQKIAHIAANVSPPQIYS